MHMDWADRPKAGQERNGGAAAGPAVLTTAAMRALEAAAIARGLVGGAELMERAGAGVVAAILAEWPPLAATPGRADILCGPGNNGGDGFVVARLLAARGWDVRVWHWGAGGPLPPAAEAMRARWLGLGPIHPLPRTSPGSGLAGHAPAPALGAGDLAVDALIGIGLARPATALAPLFRRWSPPGRAWHTVAIDVPTGIDADTGLPPPGADGRPPAPPCAFDADLTVTFHAPKPGHRAHGGAPPIGRVRVAGIGLPAGG